MDVELAEVGSLLRLRDGVYADDLLLAAVVRLDLLTVLAADPLTLDELCRHHGIAYRSADVLCTLLRAMGLIEPGEVLRPTPLARACLVRGAPFDLRPYLASGTARSTCLEQAEVLRTGQPAAWTGGRSGAWPHDPAFAEHLSYAMEARERALAPAVADTIDDLPVRSVLVVGGSRASVGALAERRRHLSRPGKVAAVGPGELFVPMPLGYDLHVLSHTLHSWNERQVRQIVGRCYDALRPGGWLVDVDAHLNADKTGPLPVARYSALLLYATEGQCWSVVELTDFLEDAGFVDVSERPAGPDRTAILARKPPSRVPPQR